VFSLKDVVKLVGNIAHCKTPLFAQLISTVCISLSNDMPPLMVTFALVELLAGKEFVRVCNDELGKTSDISKLLGNLVGLQFFSLPSQ